MPRLLVPTPRALALVSLLVTLLSAAPAFASDIRGPFGEEKPAMGEGEVPVSQTCGPDAHGVTVRLVEQSDDNATPEDEYRALVARTDEAGAPVEPPFAFASNPSAVYPIAVACDGSGGFVVVWEVIDQPCLRVRAFDRRAAAIASERMLTPRCVVRERLMQFDRSAQGHYRTVYTSRRSADDGTYDDILYQSIDARGDGNEPVVLRKWAGERRYARHARVDDEAGLVVWLRNRIVRGQVIGLDGANLTDVFRLNPPPYGASELAFVEDLGDGTMLPRWRSYWQAGDITRIVAVSSDKPGPTTTTTTTLPTDPAAPWFGAVRPLQRIRTEEGSQWGWPPTLSASPNGTAIAAWTRINEDNERAVSYARFDSTSQSWTTRRELPQLSSVQKSWGPRIVNDGDHGWAAMWVQENGRNCTLVVTRSDDDGRSWSSPAAIVEQPFLSLDEANCSYLDFNVAADPNGAWIAVWADGTQPGAEAIPIVRMSRSLDRGLTWTEPSTVLVLEKDPWGDFGLAPDGVGNWGLVWSTNYYGSYENRLETGGEVFFSRSTDDGATWSEPSKVAGNKPGVLVAQHHAPVVAADRSGTWIIAWATDDTLDGRIHDWDIVAIRATDGGSTWTVPAHVANYATLDEHDDRFPSITVDGADGWLLAWATAFSVPGASGLDYDIAVSASRDGGMTWTAPVALDDSADTDRRSNLSVDVACSAPGACVATWTSGSDIPGRRGGGVKGASQVGR